MAESVDTDVVFRKYTRTPRDKLCLILDVRHHKDFKRRHLLLSYCVRLTADRKSLLDYSKNDYDLKWAQGIWWNADVLVLGEAGLKKSDAVVQFLVAEGRCASVGVFKEGIDAFEAKFPFLVGQSLKAHRELVYPAPIVDGLVYLGGWQHAQDSQKLQQLGVRRIITIHNEPRNLSIPAGVKHMAITLADLPTSDISAYFDVTYRFIEDATAEGRAVLVHCGAGTSRSATLCAAYLMRKLRLSAADAVRRLVARRSLVCPNEGFWRQLCGSEAELGLPASQRSDPERPVVMTESYGAARTDVAPREAVAGPAVEVRWKLPLDGDGAADDAPAIAPVGNSGGGQKRGAEEAHGKEETAAKSRRLAESPVVQLEVSIRKGDSSKQLGVLSLPSLRPHQRCTFGRSAEANIKLQHASISRLHAEFSVKPGGQVFFSDIGSVHGTNVNGVWVKAGDPKRVSVGMKFRFGASTRTYVVEKAPLL